jgi:hypothetical protein
MLAGQAYRSHCNLLHYYIYWRHFFRNFQNYIREQHLFLDRDAVFEVRKIQM